MINTLDRHHWFMEKSFHQTMAQAYKVKEKLFSEQSPFQLVEVYDTHALGKLLLLDGKTMVSDRDEFVYHEIMAHVSTMVARDPRSALIIGGGDGGVVTQFAKHPQFEEIHLVEIDPVVIKASRQFFPQCTQGLDDPRVTIFNEDGLQFIADKKNAYDIIIVDSTDPENFAEGLFTEEFYTQVSQALRPEGIMMAQTENPFFDEYGIKKIYQNLKKAFPIVQSLAAPMMIYPGVFWTFAFASKKFKGFELNPEMEGKMAELEQSLKWYNRNWHRGAFALSNLQKSVLGIDNS